MLIPTYFEGLARGQFTLGTRRALWDMEERKVLLSSISTKQMLTPTYFQGFVRHQFTCGIHRVHGDTEDRKVLLTISAKQMIIPTYFLCFVRDQFTFGTHPALGDTEFKNSLKSHQYQTDVDTNLFWRFCQGPVHLWNSPCPWGYRRFNEFFEAPPVSIRCWYPHVSNDQLDGWWKKPKAAAKNPENSEQQLKAMGIGEQRATWCLSWLFYLLYRVQIYR